MSVPTDYTDMNGEIFAMVAMLNYYRNAKKCPFEIRQACELYLDRWNENPSQAISRLNSWLVIN